MYTIFFSIRIKYRDKLKDFLQSNGIGTGLHYPNGLSKMQFYQSGNQAELDNQKYIDDLLSLPMFPYIRKDEIDYVCEKILEFVGNN